MSVPETGPRLSPGYWLHHAALRWRAELDAALDPLGLTPTQFVLLGTIGWLEHLGDPPTQQRVADEAGTDRMMTSKVLRTLAGRGLLERTTHESDARSVRITLTAEGRALTSRATAVARSVDRAFFGDDHAALRRTLRGLTEEPAAHPPGVRPGRPSGRSPRSRAT